MLPQQVLYTRFLASCSPTCHCCCCCCTVNIALWYYAQQNAPVRKEKKVGVKKMKRETLKQGIRVLGD